MPIILYGDTNAEKNLFARHRKVRALDRLARRAVRATAEHDLKNAASDALQALDLLQAALRFDTAATEQWAHTAQAERRAASDS